MDVALAVALLITFVDAVLLSNFIFKGKINAPKDRRTVCVAEKERQRKYVSNWFQRNTTFDENLCIKISTILRISQQDITLLLGRCTCDLPENSHRILAKIRVESCLLQCLPCLS